MNIKPSNLATFAQKIFPESLFPDSNYLVENITNLAREKIKNSAINAYTAQKKSITEMYSFIPEKIRFFLELKAWELNSSAIGDKATASERIREAFLENSTLLDLNSLHLNRFPSCIGYLTQLQKLGLFNNKLKLIPSEIGNLTQLQHLHLNHNDLTFIPQEIGKLTQLQSLFLGKNNLSSLPSEIGNLTQLTKLHVCANINLASLPSEIGNLAQLRWLQLDYNNPTCISSAIGNLTGLQDLGLNRNNLDSFPSELVNLTQLQSLHLIGNNLTSIPSEIGNLTQLQNLYLDENLLTSIPSEIGQLSALERLHLQFNPLTGLPLEITSLNSRCRVDLTGCALSAEVLERLRTVTQNPEYRGPQIHFSRVDANPNIEERSIDESLDNLFNTAEQPFQTFDNLPGSDVVEAKYKSWLSRLSFMNEFKNGSKERQKTLATKILDILKLANENQEYRQVFNLILDQAATTCGDRVALSVMHLGLQQKLQTSDKTNLTELAALLKGIWATNLLEQEATKKVSTLPFVDEIEVYLGYPVMLKERLGLPIDVEGMLYFTCSHLKDKDLDDAEALVKSKLNDEAAVHQFLISQEVWVDALKNAFSAEYQALDDARYEDLENGVDATTYQSKFNAGLIKLTKQALNLPQS